MMMIFFAGIVYEPSDGIWFSAGSWLFDPHCNGENHTLKYDEDNKYDTRKIIKTANPKNILIISNIESMEEFGTKYYDGKISIDWHQIKDDGYYGVAFLFRKIQDIDPTQIYQHTWHLLWDVESLVVWDLRAFQNLTIEDVAFK